NHLNLLNLINLLNHFQFFIILFLFVFPSRHSLFLFVSYFTEKVIDRTWQGKKNAPENEAACFYLMA
ncbi:MAG TPA: hypothetical protein PLU05_04550, partial [Candidatus Cloacimonas acidaminovorans]|nr:hypothetical protein [Candidatus Cloacimonas acidaminovorans]HOS07774.1 hypothetical protein [Candidatus Cloacimonas acidaminovorans]HPC50851.1 hypothetical protein [Candidatus Cloacimonas acidaminovorans]HPL52051.1 hypothetical protein [Candidatus Cloacimonas acidaminovorans]